jgi:PPOX class probable F420-dependent enzyme
MLTWHDRLWCDLSARGGTQKGSVRCAAAQQRGAEWAQLGARQAMLDDRVVLHDRGRGSFVGSLENDDTGIRRAEGRTGEDERAIGQQALQAFEVRLPHHLLCRRQNTGRRSEDVKTAGYAGGCRAPAADRAAGTIAVVIDLPRSARPYMPGYGTRPASEGTGLLPWAWAEERLAASHAYWLATVRLDGRPHVMPVWAVWMEGALWFSSSNGSSKTRNLRADGRCSVTTDSAKEPVIVEGVAEVVVAAEELQRMLDAENAKYGTAYSIDALDPAHNSCFRVRPARAFGLDTADFSGSPTRWRFD